MLNASLVREGGRAYCRIGVLPSQVLLILSIIHYFRYPQTVLGPTCAKWIRLINHKEIPPTGSPGWGLERPNTHSFLGAHPYCTTKCLYSVIDFEPAWIYYTDGENPQSLRMSSQGARRRRDLPAWWRQSGMGMGSGRGDCHGLRPRNDGGCHRQERSDDAISLLDGEIGLRREGWSDRGIASPYWGSQ